MDMPEIKDADGADLVEALRGLLRPQTIDLLRLLADTLAAVTHENAPTILAVVREFFNTTPAVPVPLQSKCDDYMQRILARLRACLPPGLHQHIPCMEAVLAAREKKSKGAKKLDSLGQIMQLVTESLVKKSRHEMWNAISILFNERPENAGVEMSAVLIRYLENAMPHEESAMLRHLAGLATADDVPALLSYLAEHGERAEAFLFVLRFYNADVFEQALDLIYTEKRFFKAALVRALPEVDVEQILPSIKDYNWEVIAAVIDVRPDAAAPVIDAFRNGVLKVPRKVFLEKIAQQDGVFAYYLPELELAENELLELCEKSMCYAQQYFVGLAEEAPMAGFCRMFSKKDEAVILAFIKENSARPNLPLFLRILATMMRFSGELKSYVVEAFADKREYFHTLITYLGIGRIEELMSRHYERDTSLDAMLKKYHPQELLLEVHRFKDLLVAVKLVNEAVASPRFDDRDWIFVLNSLENARSPIKMKTCLSLLKKKPQLRSQAIHFLRRAFDRNILRSQTSFIGLQKCLEFLGSDAAQVLEIMDKDEIMKCLRGSPGLQHALRDFFAGMRGEPKPKLRLLQECLSRMQD